MLKNFLLRLASTSPLFAQLKRRFQAARDWAYRMVPIDENLIVFEAFRSTKYADSPRAIYERLLKDRRYDSYSFVWTFERPEDHAYLRSDRTRLVRHESLHYYLAFARAKYWVVNGWVPLRVQKKPGQVALQCWHGTPLKRLRYDIIAPTPTEHLLNAYRENDEDMLRYDALVSPSRFATDAFTSAFNLKALNKDDIVIETGYPRNDMLVNATTADKARYRKQYAIPENKKVLLYAPTWRDDQHNTGGGYKYESPVDFDLLRTKLGIDWVVLFRAHNLVANSFDFAQYDGFVRDVSRVDDINELYILSDALMTDYSSVFFDYANLNRPILFYMYDLDHYKDQLRGFYIDLDELPGRVMQTEPEIIDALSDLAKYVRTHRAAYGAFNKKYTYLDDGKSTERVIEAVINP